MKKGFHYQMMAFNFSALFLVFVVWITAAMTLKKMESAVGDLSSGIIIAGLTALTATGFIGYFSAVKIIKPLAENCRKLKSLTAEMQTQKKRTDFIASTIKELDLSCKKFEHITETINEIRFQVHILSLNAAIEATRAEEKGSGFNVVAEELKKLAQKTAEFSKSIQATATQNMDSIKKSLALADENAAFFSTMMTMMNELELALTEISQCTGK